jgi:outer membrane protein OmpA-like peptidoglycan-associated protein
VLHAQEALPDFPYLSHLPTYDLTDSNDRQFDEFSFFNGKEMVTVEGKFFSKRYSLKQGATPASPLQITRNYANAVKAAGGEVLYEGTADVEGIKDKNGDRMASLKLAKDGKEIWGEVLPFNLGNAYDLHAIEKGEMKQEVAKAEAKPEPPKPEVKPEPVKVEPKEDISKRDLAKEIKTQGYATIYINFDVDKATIKPESQPALDYVAQMLKDNPDLNLTIAGHTDSTGTWAHNKTLSENRARAVLEALVSRGIAAGRLASVGYGQDKPIADNATEEGRAKNRRVELIKR